MVLELFAPEEHAALGPSVKIVPIRQEQLKERLGDRFRELDVPLLVEWPDGRREALLFVLEEESNADLRPQRLKYTPRLSGGCCLWNPTGTDGASTWTLSTFIRT